MLLPFVVNKVYQYNVVQRIEEKLLYTKTAGPKNPFLCPDGRVATGEGRLAQWGRTKFVLPHCASRPMMLWLSVSASCIRYSKRCKFRLKMRQNAFGGRDLPVPAGGA